MKTSIEFTDKIGTSNPVVTSVSPLQPNLPARPARAFCSAEISRRIERGGCSPGARLRSASLMFCAVLAVPLSILLFAEPATAQPLVNINAGLPGFANGAIA